MLINNWNRWSWTLLGCSSFIDDVYVLYPSVPWSNDKASALGFFIGSFLGTLIFPDVSFSKKHSTKDRIHFFIHVGHKKNLYENGLRGKMPWCELNKINTSISIWNPMRLWQLYLFEKAILSATALSKPKLIQNSEYILK